MSARAPVSLPMGVAVLLGTMLLDPALASAAPAQKLNLDPTPAAPALPERNAATALAGALAQEVDHLSARARSSPDAAWKLEASLAWRRAAHELLVRGSEPGAVRHDLVEAGFRLADARGDFDRAVDRVPPQGKAADRARAGLDRFAGTPALLRATGTAELSTVLERALSSLDPVLEVAGLPAPKDPWPVLGERAVQQSPRWSDRLKAVAEAPGMPPEAAEAAARLAAKAADAESWPDLAAELADLASPLMQVPAIAESISGAGWMPQSSRDELLTRLAAAVVATESAERRGAARVELAHLAAAARAIDAAGALIRPGAGRNPRGPIDPARPIKAIVPLASPAADERDAASRIGRLEMISQLLRTMKEVRSREEREIDRTRRTIRRDLARDALRNEEPVLRQVESLAAPDAHPTDPACASLLESQRRRIRALDAVDGVDHALAEIRARLPAASKALESRWNSTLRSLGDGGKGEPALRDAEAFVHQWNEVRELRAEVSLRRGDAAVTALCAGRVPELLGALDRRREAWAAAWAEGDGPRAHAGISPIIELFELIEDGAALSRAEVNPRHLGRWGGWDDLGGVPGATDAMDARVAMAVEALARGDEDALREALSLQAREAPLWRLRARLVRSLAEPLSPLPDGLPGAIARASRRPTPAALMSRRADDLLTLARYSREFLYAIADRDPERADAIHDFIRSLATDLRRDLDRELDGAHARPASAPPG